MYVGLFFRAHTQHTHTLSLSLHLCLVAPTAWSPHRENGGKEHRAADNDYERDDKRRPLWLFIRHKQHGIVPSYTSHASVRCQSARIVCVCVCVCVCARTRKQREKSVAYPYCDRRSPEPREINTDGMPTFTVRACQSNGG